MMADAAAATSRPFPIFERYPRLAARIPRVVLATGPSPVSALPTISRAINAEVWLKHDGLYGTVYGGNKPRKLEFILADALRRQARTVVTTGGIGTNHGLATALYCRELGMKAGLLLTYEEPTAEAKANLLATADAGADIHYTRDYAVTAVLAPYLIAKSWRRDGRFPYLLGPGGSSPRAALGYVNAGFELAEQVRSGELSEPEQIILPLGTGGTAAGLLVGLRLAGLDSRLLAVSITRAPTAWRPAVLRLARATALLLARVTGERDVAHVQLDGLLVARDWLGPGFGRASDAGRRAQERLAESEGLALDSVYTAKSMAALLDSVEGGGLRGPVLFWHTHNGLRLPEPGPGAVDRIPRSLRRVCGL